MAKLFWWYNMYSSADFAATPRPIYPADGLKIPDLYTEPAALRDELQRASARFRCSTSGARAPTSRALDRPSARHVFDV